MTVCLYAAGSTTYLDDPVGRKSTLERVRDFVDSLPEVESVVVLGTTPNGRFPAGWRTAVRERWSVAALFEALAAEVRGPETTILFCFADQPLLNLELTRRLLSRHERYRADYTFADGYPVGLAPEIVQGRALAHLVQLSAGIDLPVSRDALFTVVQKDINRLDVETELSAVDLRMLRLTLAVDCRANYELCRRLASDEPTTVEAWVERFRSTRAHQRTRPHFVSVQVIEQEVQQLSYSPYPAVRASVTGPGRLMSVSDFARLVHDVAAFAPEAVVSVSLWGEIALHPQLVGIVKEVLARPALRLVVETSGVGWRADDRDWLLSLSDERLTVIVGLDTDDAEIYRSIRGDGFAEAHDFAERLISARPASSYVQAVRLDETEPTLNDFYVSWKKRTEHVIIQKYDWFCGVLPQRKIGDLSPLERPPCWHLQRDLYVLVDGTVLLCREDLDASLALGNALREGVERVWEAGGAHFGAHVEGRYPSLCERCDEYYTFNF